MSKDHELEEEILDEEETDMGSLYHGSAQGNFIVLLSSDERFTVIPELSLDASGVDLSQFGLKAKDELIPDVCVYVTPPEAETKESTKQEPLDDEILDVLKVSKMPALVIEVLSPRQAIRELLSKFKAYFALGVKSCWLAVPSMKVINVYSQHGSRKTFDMNDTEVSDEVMDIQLPIQNIFRKVYL